MNEGGWGVFKRVRDKEGQQQRQGLLCRPVCGGSGPCRIILPPILSQQHETAAPGSCIRHAMALVAHLPAPLGSRKSSARLL